MKHYETLGGYVTRAETGAKILELMRELEDCFYTMAHLHNTEGGHIDATLAHGWRGMGELMARARHQVIRMQQGKLQ